MRARRVLRPPVDALARMIATAHRHVEQPLADQLAPKRRGEVDTLLDGTDGQTSGVADLRRRAARTGVKELLGQGQQYRRLVALGAHRLGAPTGLPVDAALRSRARPQRIHEQYDDLLRPAASLKRGWVPASLLITRLKNATPQSPLAAALGEYGRIVPPRPTS